MRDNLRSLSNRKRRSALSHQLYQIACEMLVPHGYRMSCDFTAKTPRIHAAKPPEAGGGVITIPIAMTGDIGAADAMRRRCRRLIRKGR